jgi:hypothetical protein
MVLKEYYREKDMKPEENLDAEDADTALNVGHKVRPGCCMAASPY